MKKTSILFISALLLAASSPVFSQEDSLFLIEDDEPVAEIHLIEETPVVPVAQKTMSAANQRVLNDLEDQARTKSNYIISKNKNRVNPQDSINAIENLKQEYLAQSSVQNDEYDSYVLEMQEKCEEEVQARMLEEQRMAELESDGVTLNARGQKRLENDIAGIKEKYQKQIDAHKANAANPQKQNSLLSQISSSIRSLESSTYVQSSISDENVVLLIGEYDGTKEAWPYTVELSIAGGKAVFTGNLSYTDISGKKIPSVPVYTENANDPKLVEYKKYLDSVEIFDAAFKSGSSFIEAQVSYNIKAKDPSEASSYTVTVNSVLLKNIITEKTISTYSSKDKFDVTYNPVSPVDWKADNTRSETPSRNVNNNQQRRNSSGLKEALEEELREDIYSVFNIFPPISIVINIPDSKKEEKTPTYRSEKQENKETKKETPVENRNDNTISQSNVENTRATARLSEQTDSKRSVSALLYCLPGTVNFYSTPDGSDGALTLGYNMQFSACPYLFLGLNLEFGIVESSLFSFNRSTTTGSSSGSGDTGSSSKSYYFDDWDWEENGFYLITGQLGSYVNLNNNIRFNYFGEAGICCDEFVAGAGCSFEFYSNSMQIGATVGYTGLMFNDLNYLNKLSFGIEVLF
ncbi:MAG: hypothetical protein J5857_03990 [Treponema sp.]|nr:hypothetical protein [Treponema sp.]